MAELIIKTDKKWRDFKYGYEVPKKVLASEFDYLTDGEDADGFFKYKNTWHHLSQFMRTEKPGWDSYLAFSWSNGLLIKVSKDGERYQVAYFYQKG